MSRYKEGKMIIVDGRQSDKKLSAFANLEDVLTDVMEDDSMSGRIITDVLLSPSPWKCPASLTRLPG